MNPIVARVGCAARFRFLSETREEEAKIISLGSKGRDFACFREKNQLTGDKSAQSLLSADSTTVPRRIQGYFDPFDTNGLIFTGSFFCQELNDKNCFVHVLPDMGARIWILYYNDELD
jgi:hypothetical protein